MSSEIPFAQQWLAGIFLCGWFLFANGKLCTLRISTGAEAYLRSGCATNVHCCVERGLSFHYFYIVMRFD